MDLRSWRKPHKIIQPWPSVDAEKQHQMCDGYFKSYSSLKRHKTKMKEPVCEQKFVLVLVHVQLGAGGPDST